MLVPESIRQNNTIAIDATWAARLLLLRHGVLKIDMLNEADPQKLEMWLEMFGVSLDDIPSDLTEEEYKRLLQSVILIYRLSGTPKSIQLLGSVLGASEVQVIQDFLLLYNGKQTYSGSFSYDSGRDARKFIVRLVVSGITAALAANFTTKIIKFFEIFEPVWIYLEGVKFVGDGFPATFPLIFSETDALPASFPLSFAPVAGLDDTAFPVLLS